MSTQQKQTLLLTLSLFITPVVLVRATSMLLGSGPVQSASAAQESDIHSADPAADQPPPDQKLLDRLEALREQPFGSTPFLHPEEDAPIEIEPVEQPIIPPAVHVEGLLMVGEHRTASINGETRTEGDAIDKHGEWILKRIDPERGEVTIVHTPSGMTIVETTRDGNL